MFIFIISFVMSTLTIFCFYNVLILLQVSKTWFISTLCSKTLSIFFIYFLKEISMTHYIHKKQKKVLRGRGHNTKSQGVESPPPCSNWLLNFSHISMNGAQTLALDLIVLSYLPTCSRQVFNTITFYTHFQKMAAYLICL